MVFELEDAIPIHHKNTYPWRDISIGQSLFVPKDPERTMDSLYKSLNSCAWIYYGKGSYRISICEKNGIPGVRVWRIK